MRKEGRQYLPVFDLAKDRDEPMNGDAASRPRDGEITHDAERGERSQKGWGEWDGKRHPTPPAEQGEPVDQDPASGRGRDPELGEAGLEGATGSERSR
jgi:hypothetical protein